MNDADARTYAIGALAGIALELRSLGPGVPELEDLADRVHTAAQRLHEEREPGDLADRVGRLEETTAELVRRVIGGPPLAGFVPADGPELEREPAVERGRVGFD